MKKIGPSGPAESWHPACPRRAAVCGPASCQKPPHGMMQAMNRTSASFQATLHRSRHVAGELQRRDYAAGGGGPDALSLTVKGPASNRSRRPGQRRALMPIAAVLGWAAVGQGRPETLSHRADGGLPN